MMSTLKDIAHKELVPWAMEKSMISPTPALETLLQMLIMSKITPLVLVQRKKQS